MSNIITNYNFSSVTASSTILHFWNDLLLRPVSEQKDTIWWTICPFDNYQKIVEAWTVNAARNWQNSRLGSAYAQPIICSSATTEEKSDFVSFKKNMIKGLMAAMDTLGKFKQLIFSGKRNRIFV